MTTTTPLKPEHKQVLAECLRRWQRFNEEESPKFWYSLHEQIYFDQAEHGPTYSTDSWFGPVTESARMRFLRAIRDLTRAGLLTMWSRHESGKLTNIMLTTEGEAMATALLNEQDALTPAHEDKAAIEPSEPSVGHPVGIPEQPEAKEA